MSKKRHKPEEIVSKLRQVEVLTAQRRSVAEGIRSITPALYEEAVDGVLMHRHDQSACLSLMVL